MDTLISDLYLGSQRPDKLEIDKGAGVFFYLRLCGFKFEVQQSE